ncbi:MAG: hypothetical protein AB7S87_11210, partial [Burkholderiales bacterium]
MRGAQTRARDQRERLRWNAAIAASYGVDTLFLALFAAAGTVGALVPVAYGAAAAAILGASWLL